MTDSVRRGFVLALAAAGGSVLLGACASTSDAPQEKKPQRRYTETISSVLASQNERHIVAIGRDHHYVFEVPEQLARALRSPIRTQLTAAFTPFHVDARGDITGEVTLRLPPGPAPDAARTDIGLVHQADDSWQTTIRLAGRRYSSWTYRSPDEKREKFSHPYTIEITTEESRADVAAEAVNTPVRVLADGVQLIYYAPLAPIIIPFVFLTRAKDH